MNVKKDSDLEPWKQVPAEMWYFLTKGKRKRVFIPLVVLFIILGVANTFYSNLRSLCPILFQTIVLDSDEHDVYDADEWVLQVDASDSKKALEARLPLLQAFCEDLGFVADDKETLGSKNFRIIRNPHQSHSYLLVIDIYGEDISTESLYQKTLSEILQYNRAPGISRDRIHDWFGSAKVLRCSKFWLQLHYGRIKA